MVGASEALRILQALNEKFRAGMVVEEHCFALWWNAADGWWEIDDLAGIELSEDGPLAYGKDAWEAARRAEQEYS